MKGLRGKNVLVTGGSKGIGRAIAIRFAKEGANVAINYSRSVSGALETEEMVRNTCNEVRLCSVKDLLVKADVSDPVEARGAIAQVVEHFGRLDILINNAGILIEGASHQISLEEWDRVLAVNLRGAFVCTQETIRRLVEANRGGCIVNISSVHETIPKPGYVAYSVSKGGLENMTRTLALEYARQEIRINSVAPGAIATPMNQTWIDDPEKRTAVEGHIPIGRAGRAEEIAAAVVFLASDEASYITGQTLFVDGGLTLYPGFRKSWSS